MKIFPIPTGNLKLDGGAMFGVVPKVLWSKAYPADNDNRCNWAMRCMLVDDGNHRVLIDTGIGDKQDEKFFNLFHLNGDDTLINSLALHNYHPNDITDVVFTHLHFDHVGGAVKYDPADRSKTQLVFKNAVHWTSKSQWEWAMNPNSREKASYLRENYVPVYDSGRLQFIEKDTRLFPFLDLKLFYGHTEGQIIPYIYSNNRTIVFMGDLIASAAHIPIPYVMGYDIRPLIVMEEKKKFLAEAAAGNFILFFEHDLYHECCTVHLTEKGIKVNQTFPFNNSFTY